METETLMIWLFLAIGAGLVGLGAYLAMRALRIVRNAARTEGTVSHITEETREKRDSNGKRSTGTTYWLQIGFHDRLEQPVQVRLEGSFASSVGDKVALIYDRTNPTEVRYDSFMGVWGVPIFLPIFGLFFASFGLLLMMVTQ